MPHVLNICRVVNPVVELSGCVAEVRLEQVHREAAASRARGQKLAAELSQLKIDHATALVSGVNQRDGDGWQMDDGPRRSRFCAVM